MFKSSQSLRSMLSHITEKPKPAARAMAETNFLTTPSVVAPSPKKLTGRAFYESIGRPKYIVAPMVDRSEFAWRMLTRSYMSDDESKRLLAYSPMLHARLFGSHPKVRDEYFQATRTPMTKKSKDADTVSWLDGNPELDRPLFVQFCANQPDELLEAAQYVAPYCDAVDLNLGCPQGIAKAGRYGSFLQEDWDTIYKLINKLHMELSIPVTAKMRILNTKEKTLEYAKMILSAGASIITVHGRRREQKGHNTGLADWTYIKYLRDNLPPETVIFANGNILNSGDLDACLEATGADGIMSAEGNLSDPTIFAKPPTDPNSREYWTGPGGQGGYRYDGVVRRYLDIIYKYVLEKEPPIRMPLFIASDPVETPSNAQVLAVEESEEPPKKKQKRDKTTRLSPNLRYMQGHLFGLLRPLLSIHTDIRDTLGKTHMGDMASFEKILRMVEERTKQALRDEAENKETRGDSVVDQAGTTDINGPEATAAKYRRPWWVCQPFVRPLPEEAIKIGAITPGKKEKTKIGVQGEAPVKVESKHINRSDEGTTQISAEDKCPTTETETLASEELPKAALVCG